MTKLLLIPAIPLALVVVFLLLLGGHRSADATPPATCTVPDASGVSPSASTPSGSSFGGMRLSPTQIAAVTAILSTAKGMQITRRGATIAVQTAMQESTLDPTRDNGHALGLFQQIAPGPFSAYVGYDPHDAKAASKGFFTVLLKRDPSYDTDSAPNDVIAELVQRSGQGGLYARWQTLAEAVTGALYDGSTPPLSCMDQSVNGPIPVQIQGTVVTLPAQAGTRGTVTAATPQIAKAIGAGLAWLGTTYAWGGGTANGPSKGIHGPADADAHGDFMKTGFDCSGLMLYAYAQAGITLPRVTTAQLAAAPLIVPYSQAQPGDLLFWGDPAEHVAMYLGPVGNSKPLMLEAPQSGDVVKVTVVGTGGGFRGIADRPAPGR